MKYLDHFLYFHFKILTFKKTKKTSVLNSYENMDNRVLATGEQINISFFKMI